MDKGTSIKNINIIIYFFLKLRKNLIKQVAEKMCAEVGVKVEELGGSQRRRVGASAIAMAI